MYKYFIITITKKMIDFEQAKIKTKDLLDEISQIKVESNKFTKEYREIQKKLSLCTEQINQKKKEIKELQKIIESENVFDSVAGIEGFDTLNADELLAISNGMDRTDYTKYSSNIPRWLDIERLVKEVIEFKKQYEGFVLQRISICGKYDTLPPKNSYKFTYKTPQGHYLSYGGIELIRC